VFLDPEEGDFSNNAGIVQLTKKETIFEGGAHN
jgi:hypothetical protein